MTREVRRISAREVLGAIRSGMDDQSLMIKYDLSYRQLQRLFRKMIGAGYVTPLEMAQRLCITESQVTEVMDLAHRAIVELD